MMFEQIARRLRSFFRNGERKPPFTLEDSPQNWRLARLFKASDDYICFAPFSCPAFVASQCPLCNEEARMEEAFSIGAAKFFLCPSCGSHIRMGPVEDAAAGSGLAQRTRLQRDTDLFGILAVTANAMNGRQGGRYVHIGVGSGLVADFLRVSPSWEAQSVSAALLAEGEMRKVALAAGPDVPAAPHDVVVCDTLSAGALSPYDWLVALSQRIAKDGRLCLMLPNAAEIYRLDNNYRISRLIDAGAIGLVPSADGIRRLFDRAGLSAPLIFQVGHRLCVMLDRGGVATEQLDQASLVGKLDAYLAQAEGSDMAIAMASRTFVDAVDVGDYETALRVQPFLTPILSEASKSGKQMRGATDAEFVDRHPLAAMMLFSDGMVQINALGQPGRAAHQFNRARRLAFVAFAHWPDLFPAEHELGECAWVHEILSLARNGDRILAGEAASEALRTGLSSHWHDRLQALLIEHSLLGEPEKEQVAGSR